MILLASSDADIILYIVVFLIGIIVTYFFARWVFDVDTHTRQNESIINLLTLLAKKQGATNDEIHMATFNSKR